MHNSFLMHVLECTSNLLHEIPDGRLVKLQILTLFFFDKFFQITLLGPLSDDDKFVVVDEGIDVLDDMGMVQFFHDVDLSEAFLTLPLVGHVENLDGWVRTLIFLSAKGMPCSFSAR